MPHVIPFPLASPAARGNELRTLILDIARAAGPLAPLMVDAAPSPAGGSILAEFACARDARLFAGLKREAGESVTVTPGVNLMFAVRTELDPQRP